MELFNNNNKKLDNYGFIQTFDNQNKIISYLHPENPYRSLLICYEVGLGKTYAAACLSHLYLNMGYKVLYLANSLNSINNFNKEYDKLILDIRFKSLKKNITSISFTKFYRNEYDKNYGLIIIDEAHNLRENAARYKIIKDKLDRYCNSKLLIISATPMIDSVDEFNSIINLCGEEPKIIFSNKNNETKLKINYIGTKVGNEILFLSKMKGYQLKEYNEYKNKKNDAVYTKLRQISISNGELDTNKPLDEQSSKIAKLLETIEPNKLTVVFCFFISKGIEFLSEALEHYSGYTKWVSTNIKDPNKKYYSIIDGKTTQKEVENILQTFNSIANINGNLIHILIGSSVLNESITLFRIRKLHILSPFWNYGQINQCIGRAIRIGSHEMLKDKTIDIYLHAAYSHKENDIYCGKDIDIWKIANNKKDRIDFRLDLEKQNVSIDDDSKNEFIYPEPNNITIFKKDEWIWDLTKCFDSNKFKISWCNYYPENAIGYNLNKHIKIIGNPDNYIQVNVPTQLGYTLWRSCIDNRLRLTNLDKIEKNKFTKRGKLLDNVNVNNLSNELNCNSSLKSIIEYFKINNRYFDKQIELK